MINSYSARKVLVGLEEIVEDSSTDEIKVAFIDMVEECFWVEIFCAY